MKKKIDIEYLKEGDLVSIAFIAKYLDKEICQFAVKYFKKEGFNVLNINDIFLQRNGMFSGSDLDRVNHFQNLLDNRKLKAIFFARGGYGSIRIIDSLNFDNFFNYPKWLIGFSDVTTFISHLNVHHQVPVVHGPMIFNFQESSKTSLSILFSGLKGKHKVIKIPSHNLNREGEVESQIIGGNLSILCSLLGSKSFPSLENKILFIEDVDEYMYSIDRMLFSLKRANVFSKLSGLIVGQFTRISDNKPKFGYTFEELINAQVKGYSFPVCFNFPSGHVKNNLPIFFQKKVFFKVGNEVKLEYK